MTFHFQNLPVNNINIVNAEILETVEEPPPFNKQIRNFCKNICNFRLHKSQMNYTTWRLCGMQTLLLIS